METYNYDKLNMIIKEQYKKDDSTYLSYSRSQTGNYNANMNDFFYKNLIKSYNNPNFTNLFNTAKIAVTNDKIKEPKIDNRDEYLYIHKNYI